ncbi:MAG: hypothetical protein JNL80_14640 [Phycisphaerae bacterium]|jgi:light-regulated signal transduction histidine kinase (bacteriophytochrome)|nr:hypothetical protein [Phycisphaerae bacterium]
MMNSVEPTSVASRYSTLLMRWADEESEDVLERAYELGRSAWAEGVGVVELVLLHHKSLASLLHRLETPDEVERVARSAGLLAAECVSVFEMAMRGFQEANSVLEESNRRLEAANRELDAFSYAVSHDLRAPLRAIDGFSQALIEDYANRVDAEALHRLNQLRSATRRMNELIDDLLRLSQVSRLEISREPTDLSALAAEVGAELQTRSPHRGVELRIRSDMIIRADPRLMRIVMENLLGNAWKFTGMVTSPQIEVGQVREGGEVVHFVRDNGIGFDMTEAERLFHPYQRLHGAELFPGTGIGLATVQRIIERHGGQVWAEASPGEGATFKFRIPGAGSEDVPSHGRRLR